MNNDISITKDGVAVGGVREMLKVKAYHFIKRVFDLLCSTIGCIALIFTSIIIKIMYMCSGDFHTIFYTQDRIGKDGKLFRLYKYRTMVPNADVYLTYLLENFEDMRIEYEENKKLANDPRITKAGRWIRRLSLDELPQMINVFLGDMTIIGNRPYLPKERKDMRGFYHEIIKTKPGITGYWQVSGHNDTNFKQRLKLEQEYARIASLSLDVKIFFKTFGVLTNKRGV